MRASSYRRRRHHGASEPLVECPYCRIALAPGATHCAKCALRIAPLTRSEHAPLHTRATRADWVEAGRLGALGAVGITLVSAVVALAFRDNAGYGRSLENAVGIVGGVTLVVAFCMGRVRLGAYRRHLDLADRMERESPAADLGTRVAVALAGGIPFVIALAVALSGR